LPAAKQPRKPQKPPQRAASSFRFRLVPASRRDSPAIVALHLAAAADLTNRFGRGHWSSRPTQRGVLLGMKRGVVYVVRRGRRLVATLTLTPRKPWAIDATYFTPCVKPLYLVGMAVAPDWQGRGLGYFCMKQAQHLARIGRADALRLDAYDADAGAGEFYRKCGLREVGRATYRDTPLVYFESRL